MSQFLTGIQTIVNNRFTDAAGYNAGFRTTLSTWLDTNITPLVDVDDPAADYTEPIKNAVSINSATNYWVSVDPFRSLFFLTCSDVVNLVAAFYQTTGNVQEYIALITQVAAGAPTVSTLVKNTIVDANGVAVVPTFARTAGGTYTIDFAGITPFAGGASKVLVTMEKLEPTRSTSWNFILTDSNTITFMSLVLPLGTDVLINALGDDMLVNTRLTIQVLP